LFNAMVSENRMSLEDFVDLTATAPAKAFGLQTKGQIATGFDADIAIWNPATTTTYGANDLHDNVGYNPFEGTTIKGAPTSVMVRGKMIVDGATLHAAPGDGAWQRMMRQPPGSS